MTPCVIVSAATGARGKPVPLPSPSPPPSPRAGWLTRDRLPRCKRQGGGVWGVQVPHRLNTCKYLSRISLIRYGRGSAACEAAFCGGGGVREVNQPFIMHAASWRAGMAFIFRGPPSRKTKKEASGHLVGFTSPLFRFNELDHVRVCLLVPVVFISLLYLLPGAKY